MKFKSIYINLVVELVLIFLLSACFGFAVSTKSIISVTNVLGERVISDGLARVIVLTVSGSLLIFVLYCLQKDLEELN